MANPILNIGLGVSPVLVSDALTIPRIWDAFTDPLMGKISDNFTSRFGRRRQFILFGGIIMQWIYWGCTRPVFGDTVQGMKVVGSIIGAFVIVTSVLTAIFCKERAPAVSPAAVKNKVSFYESVSVAWKVTPFIRVISVCVLMIVGQLSIMLLGMYLNIYYICQGSQELAGGHRHGIHAQFAFHHPGGRGVQQPLWEKTALRGLMIMGATGSLLLWVLINPNDPHLQIVGLFLGGPAVTGLWIVAPSMIAANLLMRRYRISVSMIGKIKEEKETVCIANS